MPRSGGGRDMGLGLLSGPDLVFKRKYRWTFEVQPYCGQLIPAQYVKLASRPNYSIEETEINFLHGKMYIPGKATWETLSVTYYDVAGAGDNITGLYSWLATVNNFTDPIGLHQSSKRGTPGSGGYSADATLVMYDGCGGALEQWNLRHVWPQSVNFGELDYTSSEEVTVELTLRFGEAEMIPRCGGQINPCCAGCTTTRSGTGGNFPRVG